MEVDRFSIRSEEVMSQREYFSCWLVYRIFMPDKAGVQLPVFMYLLEDSILSEK